MTKQEAIERMVSEFNQIPQGWIQIIAEHESDYPALPMWSTMWIVDSFYGDKLMESSRVMAYEASDIDLDNIEENEGEEKRKLVEEAIENDDYSVYEDYVDEEMSGEHCVLDKDENTTALYIYEIGDEYVIGVNGAGWNFYDGVWDRLYDLMGLKWHDGETE